jgi:hypothetical protein
MIERKCSIGIVARIPSYRTRMKHEQLRDATKRGILLCRTSKLPAGHDGQELFLSDSERLIVAESKGCRFRWKRLFGVSFPCKIESRTSEDRL